MATRQGYFDLLDWLEGHKPIEPHEFFARMRATYGIAHLFYADVIPLAKSVRLHRLHHTLPHSHERALVELGNGVLLAALRVMLSSVRPLEHGALRERMPVLKPLFSLATLLDLPVQGISYPLVSPAGRAAVLSISVPVPQADLPIYLRHYGRDIHTLSALFHAALVDSEQLVDDVFEDAPSLTPREREVLHWSAAGKSYWEIATILGISERTVRFFMGNARRKLDVVSNTQAVAEAVWRGLIPQA
ncbi:LuxR C-terminal-related transcriptional regulator [Rhizobium sp. BK251]|uniref:helix-turn-helix transcriptional regulator n=1 Tax=Rhizobium sp. BK251 TaxID=2512125 RepID=UPI0010DFC02F|nr:LuxR C-terminal-related transcriptional regulator [Rhizobium sp. BK251]TCL73497.1 LuxR family quorum-sensing system transcriptional regulator SinR [Rhizobium sp. BK251]